MKSSVKSLLISHGLVYITIMRKLFATLFLLSSATCFAQSADYSCEVLNYRVDLTLTTDESTSMWLSDTMTYETVLQGYANFIEKNGASSIYHFHQDSVGDLSLTFKTSDAVDLPQRISGVIQTTVRPILMREAVVCSRR